MSWSVAAMLAVVLALADAQVLPPLPDGFGQIEAQLRAAVDNATFLTTFSSVVQAGQSDFGDIRYVIGQSNNALFTLPGNGLAQGQIALNACALWAPHYHPRANEILYVTEGNLEMAFAEENKTPLPEGGTVGGRTFVYAVPAGSSLIVPQGLVHYVFNPTCDRATIVTSFDNRDPGVASIVQKLFGFEDNIVSAATGLEALEVRLARAVIDKAPVIGMDAVCAAKCTPAAAEAPQVSTSAGR